MAFSDLAGAHVPQGQSTCFGCQRREGGEGDVVVPALMVRAAVEVFQQREVAFGCEDGGGNDMQGLLLICLFQQARHTCYVAN